MLWKRLNRSWGEISNAKAQRDLGGQAFLIGVIERIKKGGRRRETEKIGEGRLETGGGRRETGDRRTGKVGDGGLFKSRRMC